MGGISFCQNCNKKVEYEVKEELREEFKGYKVNVKKQVPICKLCEEEIFVPEIDGDNLKRLYEKYGEVAGIISSKDIINFRKKLNISQRELVAIMNWGKMTINRYERGAIPSSTHNDLLKLMINDENFLKDKVEEAYQQGRISEKTYNKIINQYKSTEENMYKKIVENTLKSKESEFNGFKKFDIEKLINLISFLADKVTLHKTSLNKYLWYIDMESFRRNLRSITGLKYMKYTHGPIIENFKYEEILNLPQDNFYKNEQEDECMIKTEIKSTQNYDLSIFEPEELEVIKDVIDKFKNKRCSEISNLSHQEKGWLKVDEKDYISYDFAKELKVNFEKEEV